MPSGGLRQIAVRLLHVLDPDGFVVELAQEIPRELPRYG